MARNITTIIAVSDSEEEDEANLPSKEECEQRCKSFSEITAADSALAMMFLQQNSWNLEAAIGSYFQDANTEEMPSSIICTEKESLPKEDTKSTNSAQSIQISNNDSLTLNPPMLQRLHVNTIKVLSWNIDGLDPDNLQSRTEGTCGVLNQENAEIIFLQEVVEKSLSIIKEKMARYHIHIGVEGRIMPNAYFTAMLLRQDCAEVESVSVIDFPSSMMTRNLLEVKALVQGKPMTLLTSHLESTAEHATERKKQLKAGFSRMAAAPSDHTVIFGGDLNLRDKELTGESAKPQGIYDIWECTGKRPEAKNTWDLLRNDNKQLAGKFQPRCRFDRLYIKHSKPPNVKPVYFEIVGIQRLASCHRFPSDHWGILGHLNILPGVK